MIKRAHQSNNLTMPAWESAAPMMAVSMVLVGGGLVIAAVGIGLDSSKVAVLLATATLIIAVAMMLEYVG